MQTFYQWDALEQFLRQHRPCVYLGAQTSTVLPAGQLRSGPEELALLCELPKLMELKGEVLVVEGPVSWREARDFCRARGRDLLAWPTEESAHVLAGLATSATGERSFGAGPLRDHVVACRFYNGEGELKSLCADVWLQDSPLISSELKNFLQAYQADFKLYRRFKNGPFPRLERETDLMVGTEGQLGVLREASLKTRPYAATAALLVELPDWRTSVELHLRFYQAIQAWRDRVWAAEMFDSRSLAFLPSEHRPFTHKDGLYFETREDQIEELFLALRSEIPEVSEEHYYFLDETRSRSLRLAIPRGVSDHNARFRVKKLGTDIQAAPEFFPRLLSEYQKFAQWGVDHLLFGHFGDAHLHFNFLAEENQYDQCLQALTELYQRIQDWVVSPFAEHGVGLLKRPFIEAYYGENQRQVFRALKRSFDPHQQFFPSGYMT